MERKQSLTAVKQNGSGGSTPSPCTSSYSNGGQNFPSAAARISRASDASEREKKREG
jgi:hypothetical protein